MPSVLQPGRGWRPRARCDPPIVGLELHTKLAIEDPQIAIAIAADCLRHDRLHLLRDHADIGFAATYITEAIEAKAVIEMAEKDDVVFKREIRASSAAAATTASAARTTAATTPEAAATPAGAYAAASSGAETRPPARRLQVGSPPG